MRKIYFFLFAAILNITVVFSQSNFLDGYIITENYDTIFGKIDNRNYYENSQYCHFKPSDKDSLVIYNPYQIYGYRFSNGKYYISKEINNEKVFAEYLVHGKLDVYFLQDSIGDNHYFVAKDFTRLEEIIYKEGIKNVNGVDKYYESKPFVGVLTYLTYDCPDLKSDIYSIKEPNHRNLIKVAEKYHNMTCDSGKCIIYEKKVPKKILLNIYAGDTYFILNTFTVDKRNFASGGFNLLFQQSQKNESLYFGVGFFIEGNYYKGDTVTSSEKTLLWRIPISFSYQKSRLGFSPTFSYQFDIIPFLAAAQAIEVGIKYQMNELAVCLSANLNTVLVVLPYAASVHLGLIVDLN